MLHFTSFLCWYTQPAIHPFEPFFPYLSSSGSLTYSNLLISRSAPGPTVGSLMMPASDGVIHHTAMASLSSHLFSIFIASHRYFILICTFKPISFIDSSPAHPLWWRWRQWRCFHLIHVWASLVVVSLNLLCSAHPERTTTFFKLGLFPLLAAMCCIVWT